MSSRSDGSFDLKRSQILATDTYFSGTCRCPVHTHPSPPHKSLRRTIWRLQNCNIEPPPPEFLLRMFWIHLPAKGDDKLFPCEREYICSSSVTVTVWLACSRLESHLENYSQQFVLQAAQQSPLSTAYSSLGCLKYSNALCSRFPPPPVPPLPHLFFSSSRKKKKKPKSSIKKTTRDVPAFFWLFDQPHSTGETLHSKRRKKRK